MSKLIKCDFCGESSNYSAGHNARSFMIAGQMVGDNQVHICQECVDVCRAMIAEKHAEKAEPKS